MFSEKTQSAGLVNFLAWLELNKKRVLVGAGIVAVDAAVVALVIYSHNQKEVSASAALSDVIPPRSALTSSGNLAGQFLKVATDHSGTRAAPRALLQAAAAYFTEGKWTEAQNTFERVLKEYPGSDWSAQADFGVAVSLDAQDKPAEAIARYEALVKRYPKDTVTGDAKLGLARQYVRQSKAEPAARLYDELTHEGIYSSLAQEAYMEQQDLLQKFPYLRTNAIPAAAFTPPRSLVNTQRMTLMTNVVRGTNATRITMATNAAPRAAPPPRILLSTNAAKPAAAPAPAPAAGKP